MTLTEVVQVAKPNGVYIEMRFRAEDGRSCAVYFQVQHGDSPRDVMMSMDEAISNLRAIPRK